MKKNHYVINMRFMDLSVIQTPVARLAGRFDYITAFV